MKSKRSASAEKAKTASAKKSPNRPARGASMDAILAHLAGPKSPIGERRPLTAEQLTACEHAAGVALSPSLYALLSFDAGWMKREYQWFDHEMKLQARPIAEVIEEHAGPWIEAYRPLLDARFAGRAIALDQGSDSMRLLYFGDPDARGEYPVLYIDHDDMPILGVEYATFEEWLAVAVDLLPGRDEDAAEARCKQILGLPCWEDDVLEELNMSEPTPAPPPGSIARAPLPAIATPKVATAGASRKKLTDKQLDKALKDAAEERDGARLAELTAMAKERGRSAALDDALVRAARFGNLAAVTTLLAAGASANAREYYGCALARSVNNTDEVAIARVLLAAGADPNGPSIQGETVLHEAVENGSYELVRVLLEAGADPNRGDNNGHTPLTKASRSLSTKQPSSALIDLMCDHGADPNAGKQSALQWAIEDDRREHVTRLIARGADLERVGHGGRRPLHLAYACGNDALVRELIAAGADRTATDGDGISLEHVFGADGGDVRPFDVHFVASETMQDVVIEARLAVLNAAVIHTAERNQSLAHLAEIALAGHGAGADFDPTKTRFEIREDAGIEDIRNNGFVDRRWVIRVAAVSPRFMRVIAARLLGGAAPWTGGGALATLRGVSLSIRGELRGDGLDGPMLRSWLADPSVQLGAFAAPLPFELAIEPSGSPAVTVQAKDGMAHVGDLYKALCRWLDLAGMWPKDGFRTMLVQFPTKNQDRFAIDVMEPLNAKSNLPLPFTTGAYIDALKNVLRVVDAKIPLARVTLSGARQSP